MVRCSALLQHCGVHARNRAGMRRPADADWAFHLPNEFCRSCAIANHDRAELDTRANRRVLIGHQVADRRGGLMICITRRGVRRSQPAGPMPDDSR